MDFAQILLKGWGDDRYSRPTRLVGNGTDKIPATYVDCQQYKQAKND
jgi:hypothetical protein